MQGFKGQFTKIKDLSDKRRLPRLGKIRLGIKKISNKSGKEYPAEVDYFVVPDEVKRIYGEQPKQLDVLIPINDLEVVFPTAYKWYGKSKGIKCIGNGEYAMRAGEQTGEMKQIECPCEKLKSDEKPQGECSKRAHLMVILYKVNLGGVYQLDIGSINSIIDINSGLDFITAMVGRFSMVPLILKRVPKETTHDGKKQTHYPLQILLETTDINYLNDLRTQTDKILAQSNYALPAPKDENPAMDEEAIIQYVDEEESGQQIDITPVTLSEESKAEPIPEPVHEAVIEPVDAGVDIKQGDVVEPFVLTEPAKEKTDMSKFLPLMAKELTRVGSARFFKILGNHGFTKPEELVDKDVASKVYKELLMIKMK